MIRGSIFPDSYPTIGPVSRKLLNSAQRDSQSQNRSGMLVKVIRVGAAARARSMLAGKRVAVPYF